MLLFPADSIIKQAYELKIRGPHSKLVVTNTMLLSVVKNSQKTAWHGGVFGGTIEVPRFLTLQNTNSWEMKSIACRENVGQVQCKPNPYNKYCINTVQLKDYF
jgi:hypothetical protein